MLRKSLVITILLYVLSQASVYANEIDFMVLDMKGTVETKKQWEPLAKYLEKRIGQRLNFKMCPNAAFVARSAGRDILFTNPVNAVILEDTEEFEIVLTLNHLKQGSKFAGVIIVNKNSAIQSLKDLAGKKVGVVNKKFAAGGFLFQATELLDAGLVAERDFKNFEEIFNQKAIVHRVINRQLDAGFIRTGMLASLRGSEDVSQVRILNRMDAGLPYPRSTAIYPHWAILINRKTPAGMKKEIINSLLEIKYDSEVAKLGKMKGFVPASSYNSIKSAMKRMKVYSFHRKDN